MQLKHSASRDCSQTHQALLRSMGSRGKGGLERRLAQRSVTKGLTCYLLLYLFSLICCLMNLIGMSSDFQHVFVKASTVHCVLNKEKTGFHVSLPGSNEPLFSDQQTMKREKVYIENSKSVGQVPKEDVTQPSKSSQVFHIQPDFLSFDGPVFGWKSEETSIDASFFIRDTNAIRRIGNEVQEVVIWKEYKGRQLFATFIEKRYNSELGIVLLFDEIREIWIQIISFMVFPRGDLKATDGGESAVKVIFDPSEDLNGSSRPAVRSKAFWLTAKENVAVGSLHPSYWRFLKSGNWMYTPIRL